MPTGVIPVGERFYWGKVPVGVAMEAKKGSEVCVCVRVCVCVLKQTCMWGSGRGSVSIL